VAPYQQEQFCVCTSFETPWARRVFRTMPVSVGYLDTAGDAIGVYNAGAGARSGTKVLRINPASGEMPLRRFVWSPNGTNQNSLALTLAVKLPTKPTTGSGFTFLTIGNQCAFGYVRATDSYFFRSESIGNWRADVIVRDNAGAIVRPLESYNRASYMDADPLVVASTTVYHLIQIRFFTDTPFNYVDFGDYIGSHDGYDLWLDDLYISTGGTAGAPGMLPPANPVFGYLVPNASGPRSQWTLGAGATKLAAVTSFDEDTSYIEETTSGDGESYLHAASGVGSANILGVTSWLMERGAVLVNPLTYASFYSRWEYASPCQVDEAGGTGTGASVTFTVSGTVPSVNHRICIEDEIMQVSSVSGADITCATAKFGTANVSHPDNTPIYFNTATGGAEGAHTGGIPVAQEDYSNALITLSANVDNAVLVMPCHNKDVSQISVGDLVRIGNEKMNVSAVDTTATTENFTVTARGADGTTAAAHSSGDRVKYADYVDFWGSVYRNPLTLERITEAELDRMAFGPNRGGSGLNRVTSVGLEYCTGTRPEEPIYPSYQGIEVSGN